MYLEAERAMLLRELMRMRESVGDLPGAAAASQEIQVEVCNSLSSREKAEFLLEQVGDLVGCHSDSSVSGGGRLGPRPADHPEGEYEGVEGGGDGGGFVRSD